MAFAAFRRKVAEGTESSRAPQSEYWGNKVHLRAGPKGNRVPFPLPPPLLPLFLLLLPPPLPRPGSTSPPRSTRNFETTLAHSPPTLFRGVGVCLREAPRSPSQPRLCTLGRHPRLPPAERDSPPQPETKHLNWGEAAVNTALRWQPGVLRWHDCVRVRFPESQSHIRREGGPTLEL